MSSSFERVVHIGLFYRRMLLCCTVRRGPVRRHARASPTARCSSEEPPQPPRCAPASSLSPSSHPSPHCPAHLAGLTATASDPARRTGVADARDGAVHRLARTNSAVRPEPQASQQHRARGGRNSAHERAGGGGNEFSVVERRRERLCRPVERRRESRRRPVELRREGRRQFLEPNALAELARRFDQLATQRRQHVINSKNKFKLFAKRATVSDCRVVTSYMMSTR